MAQVTQDATMNERLDAEAMQAVIALQAVRRGPFRARDLNMYMPRMNGVIRSALERLVRAGRLTAESENTKHRGLRRRTRTYELKECKMCRRSLNDPTVPESKDCGGDCLECMATVAEDPDCVAEFRRIKEQKQ